MPSRVLIAGSGVAAVEAVLALRHTAGRTCRIDVLAPRHALVHRPASVAAPFGLGAPPPLDLHHLAEHYGVGLVEGELESVDAERRVARITGGEEIGYDHLVIAVGARTESAVDGALTFRGPIDVPMLRWVIDDAARGHHERIAIVLPPAASWTLPAYEIAVMAAAELRDRQPRASVTLVTTEREPLWLFGSVAAAAMRELLDRRGVALRTGVRAERFDDGSLWLASGESLPFDAVVALPRLEGPHIPGLPADGQGFLPTDAHGCVKGVDAVYAAGDVTTFPVKQGGLATQQADAAAETIAAELGAPLSARPFRPVLRGLLLTGGAPLYLRAELEPSGARHGAPHARKLRGETSSRALWWPPGKVAGRYLAPYLATARPVSLGGEPMIDRTPRRSATTRQTTRRHSSSCSCWRRRTKRSATTPRRCTPSTRRRRSAGACSRSAARRSASACERHSRRLPSIDARRLSARSPASGRCSRPGRRRPACGTRSAVRAPCRRAPA